MPDQKTCFIIAPIGDPESDTRKRSDQVLNHIIEPAANDCGYVAVRADGIDKPGIITSQVIQHVLEDELVVADLTERNPNVFYELAIRHAIRKPVVQLMQKGEQIPFDVAGTRTIHVDHRDLDSVSDAKKHIVEQIRALEEDPSDIETPISVSLDLQTLRSSERPEDRYFPEVLSTLTGILSSLSDWQEGNREHLDRATRNILERLDNTGSPRQRRDLIDSDTAVRRHRMISSWAEDMEGAERVLVLSSAFQNSLPWIYELGVDYYRSSSTRNRAEALRKLRENVDRILHLRGRDFLRHDEHAYMLLRELAMYIEGLSYGDS